MNKGYWNGEEATYRVVNIVVDEEPQELREQLERNRPEGEIRTLWFIPYIGTVRQAVEVVYANGDPFYLDNEDGTGFYKVTIGLGSPQARHSSVYPESVLEEVHEDKWITMDNYEIENESREIEQEETWRHILGDEAYEEHKKRMDALRAMINKHK